MYSGQTEKRDGCGSVCIGVGGSPHDGGDREQQSARIDTCTKRRCAASNKMLESIHVLDTVVEQVRRHDTA